MTLSKEQYHLGQQCRGLKSDQPSSNRQQAIVLGRISIRKRWDNRELRNIWKESCYDHIECSASNPLAALMWKWCPNNNFQPYSYPQRLQECADGTSIKKISNLTYTWRAEMKEGKRRKKGRTPLQGGSWEKPEKSHCVTKNYNFYISLREIYKNIPYSDLTEENFSCSNCLSCSLQ